MEQGIKKINSYFNQEDKPILSIEKARSLLPESKLSDEELQQVLLNIQQFSEMVYDLYLMGKVKGNGAKWADENYRLAA
jgi:hypothetical protein